jgi:hypothetical protein
MDIQTLLIGEIQRQCNFVLIAFEELKNLFRTTGQWDSQKSDQLWYSVQSFLVAVANISKILWPASSCDSKVPQAIDSRKKIRQLLDLDDTSPLKLRKFRNYFEHYDFELEKWFKISKDCMILDSNIIDFDPSGIPSNRYLLIRNFNSKEFKIYFRNEEYDVLTVVNAVNGLLDKL